MKTLPPPSRRSVLEAAGIASAAFLTSIISTPTSQASESTGATKVTYPESIEIDGVTYGPESGLTWITQSGYLTTPQETVSPRGGLSSPAGYKPYEDKYIYNGSSWVRNQQIALISYVGSARAMANVVNGMRVIQARITYMRNERVLGRAVSSATSTGGKWYPGPLVRTAQFDDLTINGNKTAWFVNWGTIPQNASMTDPGEDH